MDSVCYILFAFHAFLQLVLLLRDWRHDCLSCNFRAGFQLLCTSWLEALAAAMIITLLLLKTKPLWHILTILMVLLMLRKVCQMSASLKRYLVSAENWLEMVMIGLVGFIMWYPDDRMENNCSVKRHLAAVALVLRWAELITLVARDAKQTI
jgi:hypothetical protein